MSLVYQAAEVIKDIESQASDAERAERASHQKLQIARKRIDELESELRSAQLCINEARVKLKESNELAKAKKSRLDDAERRMCQLEMRARTAEMQARENANSVSRLEEAIRTQILSRRQPSNKLTKTG
jgi:chromosome segregation ATPase